MSDPDFDVTGGVGGVDAHYEDIELLARHSEQLGMDLAAIAAECHAMLANPDVLASAALNPDGVARFERALLGALDGRQGLSALAFELGADAVALRTAAASYHALDEAQARLIQSIRWAAGDLFGMVPGVAVVGGLGLAGLFLNNPILRDNWQRLLTDHPGVVDNLVGMSPGFLTGLPGPLTISDVPSGARVLGMLYPDGKPAVKTLGPDVSDPVTSRVPAGFGDLIDELGYRNGKASKANQGQIDVRVMTHPDGTRSFIVDIPGTKDWNFMPGREYDKLNDLGTNLHAMGGEQTTYEKGIIDALHEVGADKGEPIMLVGHSQGGIVAAQMAQDLHGSAFNVTHVVTAGAPVGGTDVPDNVQVLSLENKHDIVPHLDAADNPDLPNRVTVSFDSQNGTIGDNHGIEQSYLPAAQALDHNADPSVTAYRDSANVFFAAGDGSKVTTETYQVTRG